MARPFNYGLDTFCSGPPEQLPKCNHLVDLSLLQRIRDRPRPETVAKAEDHSVLLANIQNLIILLKKGVFLVVGSHPPSQEASPPAHNATDPGRLLQVRQRRKGDSGVNRYKAYAVFTVKPDSVQHLLGFHPVPALSLSSGSHDGLVDRDRTHRNRRGLHNFATHGPKIPSCGKIHHSVCTGLESGFQFPEFQILVRNVAGSPYIGVHLYAKAFSYCQGLAIGRGFEQGDSSLLYAVTQIPFFDPLFPCDMSQNVVWDSDVHGLRFSFVMDRSAGYSIRPTATTVGGSLPRISTNKSNSFAGDLGT